MDLREQVREIPHQTSITKDNAPISIDFLWYYKVIDPTLTVVGVGNFELAAQGMATTTLRSVIGGIALDDVLSQREHINQTLRVKLDEVTERWGVKVTNVEIREIIPPRDVQDAMNRQMSAERTRRALVTEFDRRQRSGHQPRRRPAPVGHLAGRGRAAVEHPARRGRQAGPATARRRLCRRPCSRFTRPRKLIDQKTMTLQYFEALKALGATPATKYIFPLEFTSLLGSFVGNMKNSDDKK